MYSKLYTIATQLNFLVAIEFQEVNNNERMKSNDCNAITYNKIHIRSKDYFEIKQRISITLVTTEIIYVTQNLILGSILLVRKFIFGLTLKFKTGFLNHTLFK